MSNILNSLLDPYDIKARVGPALVSGLPLLVSVVLLFPEIDAIWATVGGLSLYCGGATLLAQIGRNRGKVLEPRLFELWGGKPTVAMLRYSDTRIDAATKARYHSFLHRAVPGLTIPTPEHERECPDKAEASYKGANSWLLAQTRDRKCFGLLFKENINYEFRRNLWALKPWAFALNAVALALALAVLNRTIIDILNTSEVGELAWLICIIATILHTLFFATSIRHNWVRITAEAYAYQLLATCDVLGTDYATQTP